MEYCYGVSKCIVYCYGVSKYIVYCYGVSKCIIYCYGVSRCIVYCYGVSKCIVYCYGVLLWSTVDYVIVNDECYDLIDYMNVHSITTFSDLCPVEFIFCLILMTLSLNHKSLIRLLGIRTRRNLSLIR